VVFAAGFALGAIRVLLVAPRLGDTAAVALELPLMLAISWVACLRLIGRLRVPATPPARLVMGGLALALLLAAEFALALGLGGTPGAALALGTAAGLIGLAGQAAFAVLPLVALTR
jgi:hypothetical protein